MFNLHSYRMLASCINMSTKCSENLVYVAQRDGLISISFNYRSRYRSKMFNLQRKSTDTLAQTIERIQLNLLKLHKQDNRKSKTSVSPIEPEDVQLFINGNRLNPDDTVNGHAWVDGAILQFRNQSYRVVTDCPRVESVKLPACPMTNFTIMPLITLMNCQLQDCEFSWYRQEASSKKSTNCDQNWSKVSSQISYTPTTEDINRALKFTCVPSNGSKHGPEHHVISSPVEIGPLMCPFEKRFAFTKDSSRDKRQIRVVTYNILADLYADSDYSRTVLFAHCPTHALTIDYRRQLILKELTGYNADVICLQEVDKKEFVRVYEPYFKLVQDHSAVFDTKGNQVAEGVATFVRNDLFEIVESHRTILSELIQPLEEGVQNCRQLESTASQTDEQDKKNILLSIDTNHHPILKERESKVALDLLSRFDHIRNVILKKDALRKRFMDRQTVIQTSLVRSKEFPKEYFILANTHLYFAPDADHIRLLQGGVSIAYIEYLKEIYYKQAINSVDAPCGDIKLSVILCGDMNSSPDCGLYKLVTEGFVPEDFPDWSSNKEEQVIGLSLKTNLRFYSAYEGLRYTNYTPLFNGCLDYIYFEKGNLDRSATVPLPDHNEISETGGIPSDVFPSDHLALIADLKIT